MWHIWTLCIGFPSKANRVWQRHAADKPTFWKTSEAFQLPTCPQRTPVCVEAHIIDIACQPFSVHVLTYTIAMDFTKSTKLRRLIPPCCWCTCAGPAAHSFRRAHVDHSKEGFGVPRHKSCRLLRLLQPRVLAPVSLVVTLLHLGRVRAPPHDQESLHSHYAPSRTNGTRHAMVVLWICSSTLSRNLSLKGWILKPSDQYLIVIYLVHASVQNEHWPPSSP